MLRLRTRLASGNSFALSTDSVIIEFQIAIVFKRSPDRRPDILFFVLHLRTRKLRILLSLPVRTKRESKN